MGVALVKVYHEVVAATGIALLHAEVDERAHRRIELCLGVALGDELVELALYAEEYYGLSLAHHVGQHDGVVGARGEVLQVQLPLV